jgi:hypothetical protein
MHFIFEVHIKPGYTPEQYAEAWVRASEIIQRSSGVQGSTPLYWVSSGAPWSPTAKRGMALSAMQKLARHMTVTPLLWNWLYNRRTRS